VKQTQWLIGLLLVLLGALACPSSAQVTWDPKEFMGIDEINPGMTGYGKTVFEGTKIEKFDIEVIGVLRKVDFGFDMILIKVKSGPVLDKKFQTVEGMSGSPIYIDDRLIGAYAYGWEFQQEAIAGVTPIANMLECTQPGSVTPPLVGSLVPRDKVLKIGSHTITRIKVASTTTDAQALQAKSDPTTMVLSPVATPLFVSGMSDSALAPLQKLFSRHNMQVLAGPGQVAGPSPKLEAGSAVAVSLMDGDANLSAVGTVTYVKGDTVLCFGHPFTGMGQMDMPLSTAYVHGILSSAKSSFKLASPIERVGATISDRQFAVAGTLNKPCNTLPVSLYLNEPERQFTRRYAVDMIQNPELTPLILYLLVLSNGAGQMGDLAQDQGSFTARMVVSTDKYGDITQDMVHAPMASASPLPFLDFYLLTSALAQNPYETVPIKKIFIDLKYSHERNVASIEKVISDHEVVHPGDTVNLTVKIRPFNKPVETRNITVKVPENMRDSAMVVLVAGGSVGPMLKPLFSPAPTSEEGVSGIIRYLTTNNTSAQSLITVEAFPSPTYAYKGKLLRDMPMPLYELLRYAEFGMAAQRGGGADTENDSRANAYADTVRPTAYLKSEDSPYVLVGGQVVMLAVDTDERAVQTKSRSTEFDFNVPTPVLSTSQTGSSTLATEESFDDNQRAMNGLGFDFASLMTPMQRANYELLKESMGVRTAHVNLPCIPTLRVPASEPITSLSMSMSSLATDNKKNVDVEAKPMNSQDKDKPETSSDDTPSNSDESDSASKNDETSSSPASKVLLTKKQPSWGLTGRRDFVRGKHLGTSVTSKGNLVIAPAVRSIYQTKDMLPWKIATAGNNTYLAGWNSNQVIRLDANNKSEVFFPKQDLSSVQTVTALATDAAGNVLIATWPDAHVRLLAPNGNTTREWTLPTEAVWDLAVASDGKRYAACDRGYLYLLNDDANAPVQIACSVPDKHVYSLATGTHGEVYLTTAPTGKVYRYNQNGVLDSVYEARGVATSVAVDTAGNVYVGTSPVCRVYRIGVDGTQQMILSGAGKFNHTVTALKVVGNDLYAATGPTGGIYRITDPAGATPEATVVFAREDLRNNDDEKAYIGPESVFVNALAIAPDGALLAAGSSPGQVLKLEARSQGAFLSPALQAPAVAQWGQLDVLAKTLPGQTIAIESRSGNTAMPDATWSPWQPVSKNDQIVMSPKAAYAQFRVQLNGSPTDSPEVSYLKLYYQPVNQTPTVRVEQPKPGVFWSGMKDIRWEGNDPDGDELSYTVFTSNDNGHTWRQLMRSSAKPSKPEGDATKPERANGKAGKADKATPAADKAATAANKTETASTPATTDSDEKRKTDSEVREKSIPWDTKSTADGAYRIKVVATDKYAKPTDPKSAEYISDLFIIDNTPPMIAVPAKVTGWDAIRRIEIKDNLTPILGGKFNIDGGPWTALVPETGIFDNTDQWALLTSPNGEIKLTPGEHKVSIQAVDSANNIVDRTITVTIPEPPKTPTAKLLIPPVTAGAESQALSDLMLTSLQ